MTWQKSQRAASCSSSLDHLHVVNCLASLWKNCMSMVCWGILLLAFIFPGLVKRVEASFLFSTSVAPVAVTPALLPAPTLNSPSNGATGVSLTPTFSWSSVAGANKYWLMVATSLSALPTDPNATSCPGCVISRSLTSTSYTPSTPLSAGTTYYWQVQAFNDTTNPITQGQYSARWSFTTTAARPDLIIQGGVSVSPNPVAAGGTVTVSYTVKNQGTGSAGQSTTRIQIKNASTTALLTESYFTTSALAAGASVTENRSLNIPSSASAGTYTVYVILDYNNSIGQSRIDNDIYSASLSITTTAGPSDLVVQGLGVSPSSGLAGSQVTVSFTIRNQGSGAANASTTNIRINGSSSTVTPSDPLLASISTPSIAAGGSYNVNQVVTIPSNLSPGTYYIWVILDVNSTANQSNENNDRAHVPFTVQPPAGCSLACAATVPATGLVNTPVSFKATADASNCSGSPAYEWDFGDGTARSSQQNPMHTYTKTGSFDWAMTARIGTVTCTRTGRIAIVESTPPTANFTWMPETPSVGQSVQFTDASTGAPPLTWAWDFNGDGVTDSTLQNPTYVFSSPGPFQVTLRVSNAYGEAKVTKTVTVRSTVSAPMITAVRWQYPGMFLAGAQLANTLEVTVNWNGTPGTVSFSVNRGTPFVKRGTSRGASHTFQMDRDFQPRWVASTVTITPTNGEGVQGPSWTEFVYVFPYPKWLEIAVRKDPIQFNVGHGEVRAIIKADFPNPPLAQGGPIQIPAWVPYLGGRFGLRETYARLSGEISSTGVGSVQLSGQSGFEVMGQSLDVEIGGTGDLRLVLDHIGFIGHPFLHDTLVEGRSYAQAQEARGGADR